MRRRAVISLVAAMLLCAVAQAGPARPGVHQYRQPDGTTISLTLHGDEFCHWATDAAGNVLTMDSKGFYRKSAISVRPSSQSSPRFRSRHRTPAKAYMTTGERRIPVVLVEFADVFFSFEDIADRFDRMLNQEGYSDDGANGSVRDFFVENSHGQFTPVFDVLEPVRLEKNMAFYGANNSNGEDKAPEVALYDACVLLNDTVDFSVYDADQDGLVDMVLFYFAGYDESESGPADAIWSHQWDVQKSDNAIVKKPVFDGLALGRYFCTSELNGNSGTSFKGIGSTCHEFSHSLGLPDFYDTDGSANGNTGGMYDFSTMSYGLYNNDGRTPPYFNVLERSMLGWIDMDDVPVIPDGDILWRPVQENAAYMVPSGVEGEYFLWEYRNAQGWDAPLPEGLLLYHIDRSENIAFGGQSALYYWENWEDLNNLNTCSSHPLAYIIPAAAPSSTNYIGKSAGIVFPGISGMTHFDPVGWNGSGTDYQVVDIRLAEEGAMAHVLRGRGTNVSGMVTTLDGLPVGGAVIAIDISESRTVTGSDGRFVLDLEDTPSGTPFVLSVYGDGYRKTQVEGVIDWRSAYVSVQIMKAGESSLETLQKYDASQTRIFYPLPSTDFGDCMGAVRFTSEELFRYSGRRIEKVSFSIFSPNPAEAVYVIIDYGGKRIFTREVEEPVYGIDELNEVDISDADIRIPEGSDLYVGYGIKGSPYVYPLGVAMLGHEGNSFYAKLSLEQSDWMPMTSDRVSTGYMDLLLTAGIREVTDVHSLAEMGYASIDLGGRSWRAGETLPLKVSRGSFEPVTITWLFDGEITFDDSVLLTRGIHSIQAIVEYAGGNKETLRAVITCE